MKTVTAAGAGAGAEETTSTTTRVAATAAAAGTKTRFLLLPGLGQLVVEAELLLPWLRLVIILLAGAMLPREWPLESAMQMLGLVVTEISTGESRKGVVLCSGTGGVGCRCWWGWKSGV